MSGRHTRWQWARPLIEHPLKADGPQLPRLITKTRSVARVFPQLLVLCVERSQFSWKLLEGTDVGSEPRSPYAGSYALSSWLQGGGLLEMARCEEPELLKGDDAVALHAPHIIPHKPVLGLRE